jgi:hypothetical protein
VARGITERPKMTDRDRETFFRDEKIDWDEIEKNYR